MSKGIGRLQRDILTTLEEAKNSLVSYKGGGSCRSDPLPFCLPGWVIHLRASVWLADDVFDLRASEKYLASKCDGLFLEQYITSGFQASFSRAVKSLVARGLLVKPGLVQVKQVEKDPSQKVHHLADGMFLDAGRTVRFVKKALANYS